MPSRKRSLQRKRRGRKRPSRPRSPTPPPTPPPTPSLFYRNRLFFTPQWLNNDRKDLLLWLTFFFIFGCAIYMMFYHPIKDDGTYFQFEMNTLDPR
ncbi:unnamed protein product [Rotaria sordida]|uniref:Uncharacterized protein n=1 Tax=Rotaria sordida TaxID=392033 RepID=A0A814F541_9BILA|nr:unnamed protein product [Rotaria sordida]